MDHVQSRRPYRVKSMSDASDGVAIFDLLMVLFPGKVRPRLVLAYLRTHTCAALV